MTGSPRATLFLALQAHQPGVAGDVFSLDADSVFLGGGARNEAMREETALRIGLADPWASSSHARMAPAAGRWQLDDLSSRNGTFVNGQPVQSAVLVDHDVIEIGRSFFIYREGIEPVEVELPEWNAFRTLLPSLRRGFGELARIAPGRAPIVLQGEPGTGKELLAPAVHRLSGRYGPLIPFNCGELAEDVVAAELFGHIEGAVAWASEAAPGLIRASHAGTLFLDEVAQLPPSAQSALVRVLEEGAVLPIGGTAATPVDVRLIVATHRDLRVLVGEGKLREDLYHHLAGFTFQLPPLRERCEDLSLLIAPMLGAPPAGESGERTFLPEAARMLLGYDWPGNLRQLENSVAGALAAAGPGPVGPEHLPEAMRAALAGGASGATPAPIPASEAGRIDADTGGQEDTESEAQQRDQIDRLLEVHAGNIAAVGRQLGKTPSQVRRLIKRYGIDVDSYRR